MKINNPASIVALLAASAVSLACAESNVADARYYPLSVGAVWTYKVQQYEPKVRRSSVQWKVTASTLQGGRNVYQVWPSPAQSDDEAMQLVITLGGVLELTDDVIVLRFPIRAGESWSEDVPGSKVVRRFLVRSANQPCLSENRKVSSCVVIEETNSSTGVRTLTTYGRDIGPVKYEYFRQMSGKESLVQRATLSQYKVPSGK